MTEEHRQELLKSSEKMMIFGLGLIVGAILNWLIVLIVYLKGII